MGRAHELHHELVQVQHVREQHPGLGRGDRDLQLDRPEHDDLPTGIIDSPQWLNINGLYRFPSPDGGAAEIILGGWSASVSTIMRSGFPLTVKQSAKPRKRLRIRPPAAEHGGRPRGLGRGDRQLRAVRQPRGVLERAAYTFGDTPYTVTDQRTPSLFNWDVSFDKDTRIGGGAELLLRFEFVNFFGQPNFNGQRTIFGQSNFGAITGVGGFPRTFQFMAKVVF